MIPVDLNRLREAVWDHRQGDDDTILEELVDAVLDAPTVWWCEAHGCDAGTDATEHPDECAIVFAWKEGFRGWWTPKGDCVISVRALVPVKGGQE